MPNKVFISFRTIDKDLIRPLYSRIKEEGLDVFMSSEDLDCGDIWAAEITREMQDSDIMLAFITKTYIESAFQVDKEWYIANEQKLPLLPILFQVRSSDIPEDWAYLAKRQYMSIDALGEFEITDIIRKCKRAIEKGKVYLDSPQDILNNALSLCKNGEWQKAIEQYEKIVDDMPNVYNSIVYCRLVLRQYPLARESARMALRICTNEPDTYFWAAMANIAGRNDYSPRLLERSAELLLKAWEMDQQQNRLYLAVCIAYLYNEQSFRIPNQLLELVRIGQQINLDSKLLDVYRTLLGI